MNGETPQAEHLTEQMKVRLTLPQLEALERVARKQSRKPSTMARLAIVQVLVTEGALTAVQGEVAAPAEEAATV